MELFRALGVFAEPPSQETRSLARLLNLGAAPERSEFTELFLFELYPYASVYLGSEGMLGGDARDRIAGFWQVSGERPPAEPDHLAAMLALYARIIELQGDQQQPERRAACQRMRATFLWEHLLTWLPAYLAKMSTIASPVYAAWSRLLTDVLWEEARVTPSPAQLPIHYRVAPRVDHTAARLDAAIADVLTPIKSGIIVTRADLTRAANTLGLGLRRGERRFVLNALLEQDRFGVTRWLRREALQWCDLHRQNQRVLGGIASFWLARAEITAAVELTSAAPRSSYTASAPSIRPETSALLRHRTRQER